MRISAPASAASVLLASLPSLPLPLLLPLSRGTAVTTPLSPRPVASPLPPVSLSLTSSTVATARCGLLRPLNAASAPLSRTAAGGCPPALLMVKPPPGTACTKGGKGKPENAVWYGAGATVMGSCSCCPPAAIICHGPKPASCGAPDRSEATDMPDMASGNECPCSRRDDELKAEAGGTELPAEDAEDRLEKAEDGTGLRSDEPDCWAELEAEPEAEAWADGETVAEEARLEAADDEEDGDATLEGGKSVLSAGRVLLLMQAAQVHWLVHDGHCQRSRSPAVMLEMD